MARDDFTAGFGIDGYETYRRLWRDAPDRFAEGMYRGVRRSIAAFRRDFLQQVPADIRGRGNQPANQGAGGRARTIGKGFRWTMTPATEQQVRGDLDTIVGELFTESKAAAGLELPSRVRATENRKLAIPIAVPGAPNASARGGVKPSWRYLGKVYRTKRNQYEFKFVKKPGGGVTVFAQPKARRGRGRPAADEPQRRPGRAFPIFYLTTEVVNVGNRLRFFRTWDDYDQQISRRMMQELDKEIRELAKARTSRG
jgi:hypothetical protein